MPASLIANWKAELARFALRTLVRPYILRRLKADRLVIADLPEKTQMRAFCGLTKYKVALYEQTVRQLEQSIDRADGYRGAASCWPASCA